MKSRKIVVAGPPHSGKSVFLQGLCENLAETAYLLRCCPDGEGFWTYAGNGSEQYRRKGSFNEEIVNWYCQSLSACQMTPIVLVDIGGRTSEENRRILTEGGVQEAIILSGDLQQIPEWESFLKECGIAVIATLHSDYNGEADNTSATPLVVHHLERGDSTISDRPAIKAVAEMLLRDCSTATTPAHLNIADIATAIGKYGQSWLGRELPMIRQHLRNTCLPETVQINGNAPAWLAVALTNECYPSKVALNSPDGYVMVETLTPEGQGNGIDFNVHNHPTQEGWTVLEYKLDPSTPYSKEELKHLVPPSIGYGAKAVISGRGPNWLTASIAMAYRNTAAAIACFQPGKGSTVCITNTINIPLGQFIEGNV